MAGPLMHSVTIEGDPSKIYEAISTGKGLASFWTKDSHADPRSDRSPGSDSAVPSSR
jgi:uncharacterized protein YndB with AHSA1/START domain